MEVLTSSA